jgi:O-antigen ligase
LVYLLWAVGSGSTRACGVVVLALGFVASASAVVPTFNDLLHGNKAYLAVTSLIGLIAAICGVAMLVSGSGAAFTALMVAIVLLWLIATIHHAQLAKHTGPSPGDEPATGHRAHPIGTR